jgi:hypothetical protein
MQTKPQTNYQAFLERIKSATTQGELASRENQVTRHFNNGTITVSELTRLDVKIMEKLALIENQNPLEN